MVQVGDKFTEVDRPFKWKVDKVHQDGKVDMTNQYGCKITNVDLNIKNYHFSHFGKNQFQPYNPVDRFRLESEGLRDEYLKTKKEAQEWAEMYTEEGISFMITDRTNDKIVFFN